MNNKNKVWLRSKIPTLKNIIDGIDKTLEYTDLYICNAMPQYLKHFINEIKQKTK